MIIILILLNVLVIVFGYLCPDTKYSCQYGQKYFPSGYPWTLYTSVERILIVVEGTVSHQDILGLYILLWNEY